MFYVYAYSANNEYIYIGKGKDDRMLDHLKYANSGKDPSNYHNPFFMRKLKKILESDSELKIEKIKEFVNEQHALDYEELIIEQHGRRDLGTGTLLNLNNGGSGKVPSESTKQKMREAKENYIPWNKGRKLGSDYATSGCFQSGNTPWNKGKEHMTGDKNPMYGNTHNDEIKEKIRKAATGRKRVYRDDGSYYMVKGETA